MKLRYYDDFLERIGGLDNERAALTA